MKLELPQVGVQEAAAPGEISLIGGITLPVRRG